DLGLVSFQVFFAHRPWATSASTRMPRRYALGARSPLLFDLGGLPHATAQVVELGSTHVTAGHDLDLGQDGRMHGERPLDADTEAELAHGEGLPGAGSLAPDDGALEHLGALAVALDHADVHLQGVTRPEIGDVVSQILAIDDVGGIHDARPFTGPTPSGSGSANGATANEGRPSRAEPAEHATLAAPRTPPHYDGVAPGAREGSSENSSRRRRSSSASPPAVSTRSGRRSRVRRNALARRHRAIRPWSPLNRISGTAQPRNSAGRVY